MECRDFYGYMVSDDGTIYGKQGGNVLKTYTRNNIKYATLYIDGCTYTMSVKHIVALTFLEKPDECSCVIQLDNNPDNLSPSNLKWVTMKECNTRKGKSCKQYLDGKLIKIYKTLSEAGRMNGVSQAIVSHWCNGKLKDKRGYIWEYD